MYHAFCWHSLGSQVSIVRRLVYNIGLLRWCWILLTIIITHINDFNVPRSMLILGIGSFLFTPGWDWGWIPHVVCWYSTWNLGVVGKLSDVCVDATGAQLLNLVRSYSKSLLEVKNCCEVLASITEFVPWRLYLLGRNSYPVYFLVLGCLRVHDEPISLLSSNLQEDRQLDFAHPDYCDPNIDDIDWWSSISIYTIEERMLSVWTWWNNPTQRCRDTLHQGADENAVQFDVCTVPSQSWSDESVCSDQCWEKMGDTLLSDLCFSASVWSTFHAQSTVTWYSSRTGSTCRMYCSYWWNGWGRSGSARNREHLYCR